MVRYWIQKAVKRKGFLRRWAKRHKAMKRGKINLTLAYRKAKKIKNKAQRLRVIRAINLAKTLKRLRKR